MRKILSLLFLDPYCSPCLLRIKVPMAIPHTCWRRYSHGIGTLLQAGK
jgi:hypothetical protein